MCGKLDEHYSRVLTVMRLQKMDGGGGKYISFQEEKIVFNNIINSHNETTKALRCNVEK